MVNTLDHFFNRFDADNKQIKFGSVNLSRRSNAQKSVEAGFSLIELLIVLLIIMIMTAVSIFPFIAHRDAYRTEDQALRLINFLEDAKMRALSKHRTMRFEIDLTDKALRIIDENDAAVGASDDFVVKEEQLLDGVRLDQQPANLTGILPNVSINSTPLNYRSIAYSFSNHPLSQKNNVGDLVWSARFLSDGTVVTPSGCESGKCPCNVTIFLWRAGQNNPNEADPVQLVRAVTIVGGTSNVRMWQYDGANFQEW